jgi:hypothetical protein
MSSIAISSIVFAFVFGGAVFGMFLRSVLPEPHLSAETKDVVKLGMGLVATMSALVLSLLISSAKSSYDAQSVELTDSSAKIILLDRELAHYGPETKDVRDMLRDAVAGALDRMWPKDHESPSQADEPTEGADLLYDKVQALSAKDDRQRSIQAQALNTLVSLGQTRWLMYEQRTTLISMPLLVVLVSWLTALFISFGLFAPPNGTVITSLVVAALSVSGAILLILELYTPYAGLVRISSAPLENALMHLGK